jgi:hypothetical protein
MLADQSAISIANPETGQDTIDAANKTALGAVK